MGKIYSFSSVEFTKDDSLIQSFGVRGATVMDLATTGAAILPGFILTEKFMSDYRDEDKNYKVYMEPLKKMGEILDKKWG